MDHESSSGPPARMGEGAATASPPSEPPPARDPPARDDGPKLELLGAEEAAVAYASLEQVLCELLERIRRGLNADTAALLLLDEDRGVLVARAARGE